MNLDSHVDPVSGPDLQGLLQHHGRLPPVRVLAQGADADVPVQVDVVPEGDRSDSASGRSLNLCNRHFMRPDPVND